MKILTINGFHKEKEPVLNNLLDSFLAGASKNGAEIKSLNLQDYNIKLCKGCFEEMAFESKSNQCYQDDDMNVIYPELNSADVWVLAFPYTFCGSNRDLFNFLDRFEPLMHIDNASTRNKDGKILVISTCSFWDEANYYPLLEQFKDFCAMYNMKFAGALVRPDARLFNTLEQDRGEIFSILSAAEQAGEFITHNKEIPEQIFRTVSQNLSERKQIFINN